jgi:hypothetical protein
MYTWCGYEVPGTILLHHLKGAMQLDHSKDMFVHISTCTGCDFNAFTPVVWKLQHAKTYGGEAMKKSSVF